MSKDELANKYHGKRLSTDEAAEAHNEIFKAVNELEAIKYETGPDYLLLKWGTLKGWDVGTNDKARALLKEYSDLGMTMGAMSQKDTDQQKELLCKVIDVIDGFIQNDWDGDYYTKQQAKDYVMGYSK